MILKSELFIDKELRPFAYASSLMPRAYYKEVIR